MKILIYTWLNDILGTDYSIIRYEAQHRVSLHCHCVARLKNDPGVWGCVEDFKYADFILENRMFQNVNLDPLPFQTYDDLEIPSFMTPHIRMLSLRDLLLN